MTVAASALLSEPEVVRVDEALLDDVARFLHDEMRPDIPTTAWRRALWQPWPPDGHARGYALRDAGRVVGVVCAFYSVQRIAGREELFCNINHWCVRPEYRSYSLRLVEPLLRRRDCTFTNLSVSKETVELWKKLGFAALDERIAVLVNPLLAFGAWHVRVTADKDALLSLVDRHYRRVLRDLGDMARARATAARLGEEWCLCVSLRERRKGIYTTRVIHVNDPTCFSQWIGAFARSFLRLDKTLVTTCPPRFLEGGVHLAAMLPEPRPELFRSPRLSRREVTCLYSELTR